jgi:uncharacterized protein YbaR (Trm112 family)
VSPQVIPQDVRDLLACPRCGGALIDAPRGLVCEPCDVCWPVEDGVPFLVDACAKPRQAAYTDVP